VVSSLLPPFHLIGGGRVDLIFFDVEFIFLFAAFQVKMADEQPSSSGQMVERPPSSSGVVDKFHWVADEPRMTGSRYTGSTAENVPHTFYGNIEEQDPPDWQILTPGLGKRICSNYKPLGKIPMYQIAFEHLGYRLPFTDFEVAVFRHLDLAPSQLHPNSLAFLRAFELVCAYLKIVPTIRLFFCIFHLQHNRPKGDATEKFGWVSLKQNRRLFETFEESVRNFKDNFYLVCPLTERGWSSIVARAPKLSKDGTPEVEADGSPVMEDRPLFPFTWKQDHFKRPATSFVYKRLDLSKDEIADLDRLCSFVDGFAPTIFVDKDRNPLCDERGQLLTAPRYIRTKKLLACRTRREAEDLLGLFFLMLAYFSS
jgi:hypothetical protein